MLKAVGLMMTGQCLHCASQVISRTRFACVANDPVRLIAVVVYGLPPLLFASAIIRGAGGGGIEASVSLRLGMGMSPHNGLRLDPKVIGEVETTGM